MLSAESRLTSEFLLILPSLPGGIKAGKVLPSPACEVSAGSGEGEGAEPVISLPNLRRRSCAPGRPEPQKGDQIRRL